MRVLVLLSLVFLLTPAAAYTVTVVIEGYNNSALLNITGANIEQYVSSGSEISLPEGNYTFRLFAMNKTFEKDVEVNENTTVVFDLRFTNRTDNISLTRHIIVYGGIEVMEVLMITNSGDINFEGDLTVDLPGHSGFTVTDTTLSFMDISVDGDVTFKDIIVPKHESGTVTYTYRLKSNVLSFNGTKYRILLLTSIPVKNVTGLEYKGTEDFKGKKFEVYEGYTGRVVFSGRGEVSVNPAVLAGILALSAAVFLYLKSRSGGWKL